jgi:hypothetical protein
MLNPYRHNDRGIKVKYLSYLVKVKKPMTKMEAILGAIAAIYC